MKKLVIVGLLLASALIAWGLGESRPAWGDSPVSPLLSPMCYVPMVARDWDGTKPTPEPPPPLPKHQGVGHHRPNYGATTFDLEQALEDVGADWYYDWGPCPELPGGEPMIWDETQISMTICGNSEWLQVFSEPDFISQANITPTLAAEYYYQIEQLYPDKKLVSPAVWNVAWLDDFWDEYVDAYGEEPRMDAVAIHLYPQLVSYYGSVSTLVSISELKMLQAINYAYEHGVSEVWVTEFTAQPHTIGVSGTIAYMEAMVARFESEPKVTRWAWFGLYLDGFWPPAYDTSLWDGGVLTALGEAYASGGE